MKTRIRPYQTFILITISILVVFIGRSLLAAQFQVPRLHQIFESLTVAGALIVCLRGSRCLRFGDWITALVLGGLVGGGMLFATLFSPYPFFDIVRTNSGQALVRGIFTFAASLGGLVIMRQGGPIQLFAALGNFRQAGRGILIGLAAGLPLAVINVVVLQFTNGQAISWQNPLAAMLDALQPAIVEETIYRFAMWGLLWLALRRSLPRQSVTLAGLLTLLVHNYAHFDDLFVQAPLVALGMGLVMGLIWGLPLFFLARRRGLESAFAFHWLQDAARFGAGF